MYPNQRLGFFDWLFLARVSAQRVKSFCMGEKELRLFLFAPLSNSLPRYSFGRGREDKKNPSRLCRARRVTVEN